MVDSQFTRTQGWGISMSRSGESYVSAVKAVNRAIGPREQAACLSMMWAVPGIGLCEYMVHTPETVVQRTHRFRNQFQLVQLIESSDF